MQPEERGRLKAAAKAVQAHSEDMLGTCSGRQTLKRRAQWIVLCEAPKMAATNAQVLGLGADFPDADFLWKREALESAIRKGAGRFLVRNEAQRSAKRNVRLLEAEKRPWWV